MGVGGQDNLAEAEDFIVVYGGPPTMLWSKSLDPWRHYRASNDSAVLLDGNGNPVDGNARSFDRRRIEDMLADLA